MTTKVKLECPDNSHWHAKVEVQDNKWDPEKQELTGEFVTTQEIVLKQGEKHETYITSTRRLLISEMEPSS